MDSYRVECYRVDDKSPLLSHPVQCSCQRQKKRSSCCRKLLKSLLIVALLTFIASKFVDLRRLSRSISKPCFKINEVSANHLKPLPTWCTFDSGLSESFSFSNLSNFSLLQEFTANVQEAGPTLGSNLNGTIYLVPGSVDQVADIQVNVSINASEPFFTNNTKIDQFAESLLISVPVKNTTVPPANASCLMFNITVAVRPGLELTNFGLSAALGDVQVAKDLGLSVSGKTDIALTAGNLNSTEFFNSTNTYIYATAGSVLGNYSVFDALEINSNAGVVHANITPLAASSKANVVSSSLVNISSTAGTILVNYPPLNATGIPEKDYKTYVSTGASIVRGQYLFGSEASISSTAGGIIADVIPYSGELARQLSTVTGAGVLKLNLTSPIVPGNITNLNSTHLSTAGTLTLEYPPEWEGVAYGETTAGKLNVTGTFDTYEEGKKGFMGNWVKAQKGTGASTLSFSTTWGTAALTVDDKLV